MEQTLEKLYAAIDMLDQLGLPISQEQLNSLQAAEQKYVEEYLLPTIKEYIEPLVGQLRTPIRWQIEYSPESGVKMTMPTQTTSVSIADTRDKPSKQKNGFIKVIFPDGRVVQDRVVLNTLITVVEYAGPKRVQELNIWCIGDNLIRDTNEDEAHSRSLKQLSTGQFIITNSNTDTKYNQIVEINNHLQLGLQVIRIPK